MNEVSSAAVSALALALALTACSGDDDRRAATTTTSPVPVSTSTTTSGPGATDAAILVGVAAGSPEGATLLPDEQWVAGVRRGCDDLPEVPDDQIDDFFDLLRIQVESDGGTREQSRAAVQALVGGFDVACPALGQRLEPLIPAE